MAIAFVNVAFSTASTTAGNSKNITYTSTAGNTIIVFGFAPGTATVTNVTDTANNVYSLRSIGTTASVWSTEAGAAKTTGSITITVTFSGSIRNTCAAVGYSGVPAIGKPRAEVTGSSNAPSASFTTQNSNNVFVAGMGATGTATWSLTTGTALRGSQAGAGATTPGCGIIDNTSASPASVTCTAGLSGSEAWGVTGIELATVQASIDSDDSYWQNRVSPVPATNQVPNQWQFDPSDIVPALIVPAYSRAVTIDHTQVGGSDRTDYVALVKGNYPFLATVANGGLVQNVLGYDVVFYSDSALTTRLNWQVENYNADGDVVYWVRIPSVSHTVDTTFYIAYGSSLITTDQSNTFGTWNISSGPAPAYHLNNASFADSHNNNAQPAVGQNSPTTGSGGQIGTGTVFNGSNQNAYVLPAADPGGVLFPTSAGSPGSVSLWISLSSYGTQVVLYQDGGGHNNFAITVPTSSSGTFGFELGSNPGIVRNTVKNNFLLNTLYKIDLAWNASNLIAIYINGVLDNSYVAGDSTSGGPSWSTTIGSFAFGTTPTTGNFFNGALDELRVYPAANSADFITCSYNNEASPSSFYSIGQQRPGQALEDDSWWSSVMQSGATVALATALSISAMTGVVTNIAPWQDELPQTSTTLVVEDSGPYLPPAILATLQYPQQWGFDTPEDVTHIDEDYWSGSPSIPATNLWPQQSSFDEQIPAGSLFGQPDEDYWANPTAPVSATLQWPQPWIFDEQIPAGSLFGVSADEYWQNPVPAVPASLQWPQQSAFSDEVRVAPSLQFDEDYWQSLAVVPPTTFYPQQFQFDTQEELGHLDEDFWVSLVAPVSPAYVSLAQWGFDEVLGPATARPDEDYWSNPVSPVPATLYPFRQSGDEQIPSGLHGPPEEEFWSNPARPVPASNTWPQPWTFAEELIVAQPTALDEPSWFAVVRTQDSYYPQQFGFDTPETFVRVDEDYWQNLVLPAASSLVYPNPWVVDAPDVFSAPPEESYWQSGVVPVQATFVSLLPAEFDTLAAQLAEPNEDYWVCSVYPVGARLTWPNPWSEEAWVPTPPRHPVNVRTYVVTDTVLSADFPVLDVLRVGNYTTLDVLTAPDVATTDTVRVDNFTVVDTTQVRMSIPSEIRYTQHNPKLLTFGPVTSAVSPFSPITGATVTATLYANRVNGIGGTVVPQLNGLVLADIGAGVYQGVMDDETFAPPVGYGYTTVIDFAGGGDSEGHWELASQVTLRTT